MQLSEPRRRPTVACNRAEQQRVRLRLSVAGASSVTATLVIVWLGLAGCNTTGLSSSARRFTPPAQFRAWWALIEACSGLRGDFNAVAWYVDPNANAFTLEGASVNGAWYPDGNRIVLGDSVTTDGSLVRHEMLHALTQSGTHPRQQFLANCSDIVVCIEKCVSDAGGPPDTSDAAPILGASSLTAAILIAPDTESVSSDSGWVTVAVTIRNASGAPARVPLIAGGANTNIDLAWSTSALNGPSGAAFGYYFTLAPADSAGSVRRVVFDEQVALTNPPSLVTFSGTFGPSAAPAQTLTVIP